MTFSTPWGALTHYLVASTANTSSTERSQRSYTVISRALNNRDIMIGGLNWKDHNTNLQVVLQQIEDHNLTSGKEKWQYGKKNMTFQGHLLTTERLKPRPDKICALEKCTPLKIREERISFLHTLANLSQYISNFWSRCEPLRQLRKKWREIQTDEWTANRIWKPPEGNYVRASTDPVHHM